MSVQQNYINHIGLVLDASYSMHRLESQVVKIADNQVTYLATSSSEMDQETRATVYTFSDTVECMYYDKDVLRLPSLVGKYRVIANTALIDAVIKAIEDLKQTATLYGDHAFLLYVLTDGLENRSKKTSRELKLLLDSLPDNWTIVVLVPDATAKYEAKKLGFDVDNIQIWSTTAQGIEEVGKRMQAATKTFMEARRQGVRSFKNQNIFSFDLDSLNLNKLQKLPYNAYDIFCNGSVVEEISPVVERLSGRPYKIGSAYYELSKTETIQPAKLICIQDKDSGDVYSGSSARSLLGLPNDYVKVKPEAHPKYKIFVQSTSVNRKLMPNREVLVLR